MQFTDESDEGEESAVLLRAEAFALLAKCSRKPVIAVDLDHTLWPLNCYEDTKPPYSPIQAPIKPTTSWRCSTRHGYRTMGLYPEVREVLEWCGDQSLTLTICSRSPHLSCPEAILTALGMWEWFLYPQVYDQHKSVHFQVLADSTNLPLNNFLFFDDLPSNIKCCSGMGVMSCLVDRKSGLDWEALVRGLRMYRSREMSRNVMGNWLKPSST
ncbi:acid phosphatase-domain-containing protein [Ochromonadaceae sp. CCMP2298]|nr:acid phosphatase-domain-containing protein [Ochromonadaceae sp. CCMP2298]|mmetsp:Transcript_23217/g.51564  ORF Transcript_23217/g.51564 Transcript_23217/m.51564 type:complete len:213 (+) Transcript_23217:94-732(+)